MKTSIIIITSLLSLAARAGEKGNGGDIIICKDAQGIVKSGELYDHFEGRSMDGRSIDLGPEGLPELEKVELVIKRIEKFDKFRAELYRQWANEFYSEAALLEGIDLIDIPDTGDGYIPASCELKQLVVQQNTPDQRRPRKRYTINSDLWQLLDNNGKAGTILHELILREVTTFQDKARRHEDSRSARFFNSYMTDVESEKMDFADYTNLLARLDVYNVSTSNGFKFGVDGSTVAEKVPGGYVIRNTHPQESCQEISLGDSMANVCTAFGPEVYFLDSGVPAHATLFQNMTALKLESGWKLSYTADTFALTALDKNRYSIVGQTRGRTFNLRHEVNHPRGCEVEVPYDESSWNGLRYYSPRSFTSVSGIECYERHSYHEFFLPTPQGFIIARKVQLTGDEEISVSGIMTERITFPVQSFDVTAAKLLTSPQGNFFRELTMATQGQRSTKDDGSLLLLKRGDIVSVDDLGNVTGCRSKSGGTCEISE